MCQPSLFQESDQLQTFIFCSFSSSLAIAWQYIHHGLNAGTDLDDDDDNDDRDDDDDCGQGLVACSALV